MSCGDSCCRMPEVPRTAHTWPSSPKELEAEFEIHKWNTLKESFLAVLPPKKEGCQTKNVTRIVGGICNFRQTKDPEKARLARVWRALREFVEFPESSAVGC